MPNSGNKSILRRINIIGHNLKSLPLDSDAGLTIQRSSFTEAGSNRFVAITRHLFKDSSAL